MLFLVSAIVIICFSTLWEPVFQINDALRDSMSSSTPEMQNEVNRATFRTEWALMAVPVVMIGGTALWYMIYGTREEKGRF